MVSFILPPPPAKYSESITVIKRKKMLPSFCSSLGLCGEDSGNNNVLLENKPPNFVKRTKPKARNISVSGFTMLQGPQHVTH